MNTCLVDEQSWLVTEKGLASEVGVGWPSVAHAHADRDGMKLANGSRIHLTFDFAVPRLPTPIFVHEEGHLRFRCDSDDLLALLESGSERLLANDGDASFGR